MIDAPTRALREHSPEVLRAGLIDLLVAGEAEWLADPRDLFVNLARFHDCAVRLGLSPVEVFDEAAAAGPPSVAQLVRDFGRRTDVTPREFAFRVVETPDGPSYVAAL